jgi:hypothetical protein
MSLHWYDVWAVYAVLHPMNSVDLNPGTLHLPPLLIQNGVKNTAYKAHTVNPSNMMMTEYDWWCDQGVLQHKRCSHGCHLDGQAAG